MVSDRIFIGDAHEHEQAPDATTTGDLHDHEHVEFEKTMSQVSTSALDEKIVVTSGSSLVRNNQSVVSTDKEHTFDLEATKLCANLFWENQFSENLEVRKVCLDMIW